MKSPGCLLLSMVRGLTSPKSSLRLLLLLSCSLRLPTMEDLRDERLDYSQSFVTPQLRKNSLGIHVSLCQKHADQAVGQFRPQGSEHSAKSLGPERVFPFLVAK